MVAIGVPRQAKQARAYEGLPATCFEFQTDSAVMADARYRGVQNDRRHGIASAHAICPSKPSVFAMSR